MPSGLRIALLSDVEWSGGAAVAASRLARGLATDGHDVTRLVHIPNRRDAAWSIRTLAGLHTGRSRFVRQLSPGGAANRMLRFAVSAQLARALAALKPDVINLHNLHSAGWHPELAAVCAAHAPVVWTLHDMWSFTGRCAYSFDCRLFETGCNATCPTPHEYPTLPPSRIANAWEERRRLLDDHDICAVTPSRWLRDEAARGLWAGHRIEVIPYGLPLDVFRPHDRTAVRQQLGLDGSAPVLLMTAADVSERRKGGALLRAALALLNRDVTLLIAGEGQLGLPAGRVRVLELGQIADEEQLARTYSAADLLVHPAPVDNLPNVVLESIACSTPVVGFPIGGVPDMVRPGITGWLARDVSVAALASALHLALDQIAGGIDLRSSCRAVAEQEYGQPLQAARYARLFESLITNRRATHGMDKSTRSR